MAGVLEWYSARLGLNYVFIAIYTTENNFVNDWKYSGVFI